MVEHYGDDDNSHESRTDAERNHLKNNAILFEMVILKKDNVTNE